MIPDKRLVIIGYGGHSYVVIETAKTQGSITHAYFDPQPKEYNPYNLLYFGSAPEHSEHEVIFNQYDWFVGIGSNKIRSRVQQLLSTIHNSTPATIVHAKSILAEKVEIEEGSLVAAGAILQPLVVVGKGVICNSACVIEHECIIGDYVHIGPGAVLSGAVQVGKHTFIGANSIIKQGTRIGQDCIIGAGAVVLRDVPDGSTLIGNPAKPLLKQS